MLIIDREIFINKSAIEKKLKEGDKGRSDVRKLKRERQGEKE